MPQQVLCLEIEPREIRAANLEVSFRDFKIVGLHRVTVAADESLDVALRRLVQENQLRPHTVVASLPGDVVTLRTFFLPFRDRKRLDQTVPFELETLVPFDLDDIVVAYQVLSRDKDGSHVLAALVTRKDLEHYLNSLQAAGLDPKIVDIAPLASLNLVHLLDPPPSEPLVFVAGDLDRVTVGIYRNGTVLGLRTITPAAMDEDGNITESNGRPERLGIVAREIVGEIRWTLLALGNGVTSEGTRCLVASDGAYFDEIAHQLRAELGLEVIRFQESPLKGLPQNVQKQAQGFAAPIGLALREVQSDRAFGLNFRQGEFAYHRAAEEVRRAFRATASIAAVALALFVLQTFLHYRYLQARLDAVNAQVRYVFRQTLPDIQRVVDESRQLQEEIAAAEKRLKLLGSVAPPSGATAIDALQAISSAIPDTLKIEVDEYVMDTEEIKIRAHTDSLDTPNAIREAIARVKYFADVQVKDIKSGPDGRVDFRMVLALNKGGTPAMGRGNGRP